ncbi:F-box domain protein [Mycena venus]|uniref:F-box domain protein n=1 Tax=Mycena venus TaxID=2733690 RepID=A0A8H6Y800_9AGAR|nr:F-box domain protein [Mycena venus]
MSARDSVIQTPELVEHTLALLPVRDLLVIAPLVSKMWQAITLSPTLQRALFFEADPTASASQPVQNPLLVELFQPFFAPNAAETFPWPGTATSILEMPWAQAPEAFKRADASWRRMLVTQPPVQTMVVIQTRHGMGGSFERRAVLRDLSLRMGMLYDFAVPFLHHGRSSFRIIWNNGIARESDITFMLSSSSSCMIGVWDLIRAVDERFDSVGGSEVKINYGEWVHLDDEDEDVWD